MRLVPTTLLLTTIRLSVSMSQQMRTSVYLKVRLSVHHVYNNLSVSAYVRLCVYVCLSLTISRHGVLMSAHHILPVQYVLHHHPAYTTTGSVCHLIISLKVLLMFGVNTLRTNGRADV